MAHRFRLVFLAAVAALTLAGCDAGGLLQPTPEPIIIVATAPPETPGSTAQPTAAQATAVPAATPAAGATPDTADPTPDTQPPAPAGETITFAFDAFPSYYPGIVAKVEGLLEQRGYQLELVPFLLNDANDFSEEERFAQLRSGEWDVLATTLDGFARQGDPAIGAITTIVDESAGADKLVALPEIATINDLAGRRVAYSEGSVGEYFLYYALSLAGLTPADVTLVPRATVAEAVQAYLDGEADAVSAWEPDVLAAEEAGAQVLIASDELRAILDVLVTSRQAIDNRPEAVEAFHAAWYEALKLMTDNPSAAEQAIIAWGNPDWTAIAAPGDLAASLETIAQATLGANQLAFRSPELLISRIREAQQVWANAGQTPPQADLAQLIDGRFVSAVAQDSGLFSTQPPVNSSFLLTAQIDLPQLSDEQQQEAQEIVQLPLEKIDFEPDSLRLTEQARRDLTEQVLPVLRSSRLYLKIEGSSAWPGPEGRFTAQEIEDFARARATSVATFLSQQGINPNRLIIDTLEPQFPNSLDEEELAQDRIVRFTLITPQGR